MVREEGVSYGDAAAALGKSPNTIRNQVVSAQRRFRDELRLLGLSSERDDVAEGGTNAARRRDKKNFAPRYVSRKQPRPPR